MSMLMLNKTTVVWLGGATMRVCVSRVKTWGVGYSVASVLIEGTARDGGNEYASTAILPAMRIVLSQAPDKTGQCLRRSSDDRILHRGMLSAQHTAAQKCAFMHPILPRQLVSMVPLENSISVTVQVWVSTNAAASVH